MECEQVVEWQVGWRCVCGVLQQRGVCVDSVSSAGDTALQCAIKHGCLLSAVMLIQALSRQQFTRVLPSLRRLQVTACLPCVYSRSIQTRQRSHSRSQLDFSLSWTAAGSEGQGKEGREGKREGGVVHTSTISSWIRQC